MQVNGELDWADTMLAIGDEAELEAALDRVVADSDPAIPYVANLTRGDAIMSISETREWAIVSFGFENGDEPFHVSLGDRNATGVVEVLFAGEWTEQARWSCIEPALARESPCPVGRHRGMKKGSGGIVGSGGS